jgi:hypothetical protein
MSTLGNPLNFLLDRVGRPVGTAVDHAVLSGAPIEIPSPGDLLGALTSRLISQKNFALGMQLWGYAVQTPLPLPTAISPATQTSLASLWSNIVRSKYAVPTIDQGITLANRGLLTTGNLSDIVKRNGMSPEYVSSMAALQNAIPGPSDLVRMVVRDVWDPAAINRFGYDDGFATVPLQWFSAQGLAYPIVSPPHDVAGLGPFSWARAYWWAHWQLPSVTQGIQMFQRLRPSLADPNVPRDPSGLIVTADDLKTLIRVSDYPTYWQARLQALGYNPIGIRNLRALFANGLLDKQGVQEVFLDQGFNQRDALLQANLIASERDNTLLRSGARVSAQFAVRGFDLGTIDINALTVQLYRLTLTNFADLGLFDAQPIDKQLATASADQVTAQLVNNAQQKQSLDRTAKTLAALRKSYLRGVLSIPQVTQNLINIGITPDARSFYLSLWSNEKLSSAARLTPAQQLRLTNMGLIDVDTTRTNLTNLGYSPDDVTLLLTDASLSQSSRQAQALITQAKGVSAQLAVAERQAKAAKDLLHQAQVQLRLSASPAKLESFLRQGLITPAQFSQRMAQIGILPQDIAALAAQVAGQVAKDQAAAAARSAPKAPKAPKGVTVASLERWYKKGIYTESETRVRLAALGVLPADIDAIIADAQTSTPKVASNKNASSAGS